MFRICKDWFQNIVGSVLLLRNISCIIKLLIKLYSMKFQVQIFENLVLVIYECIQIYQKVSLFVTF